MIARYNLLPGILLILFGCDHPKDQNRMHSQITTANKVLDTPARESKTFRDTSNQYLYDFMKVVMADQELYITYGLQMEPEHAEFNLQELLITENKESNLMDLQTIGPFELPKCLDKADIKDMMSQKQQFKDFTWDNSRLGFDTSNHHNWYSFSIPLFSKDRKKAIMKIENLCPGLCGIGWIVLFKHENGKWSSYTGSQWFH